MPIWPHSGIIRPHSEAESDRNGSGMKGANCQVGFLLARFGEFEVENFVPVTDLFVNLNSQFIE